MREDGVAGVNEAARRRQAAASSRGGEIDGGMDDASPALPPHKVDLAKSSSTKLIPEQAVKMEKLLMEYQDVFSRDAQDFGCMSLVQHSIDTADSPPINSHIAVSRWPRGKRCNAW